MKRGVNMGLIGTSDVRNWLQIPEADKNPNAKIETLIDAIQAFVESETNRKLEAQRFSTHPDYCYLDGFGKPFIYLPVYPIWNIYEVAIDNEREFGSGSLVGTDDIFFYPDGKVVSEVGYFTRGRRNVRFDYYAGYGAGSYPLPSDLKQVMVEMTAKAYKDGLAVLHAIPAVASPEPALVNMYAKNSFWKKIVMKYKRIAGLDYSYDSR